jgi:hypothetical protein
LAWLLLHCLRHIHAFRYISYHPFSVYFQLTNIINYRTAQEDSESDEDAEEEKTAATETKTEEKPEEEDAEEEKVEKSEA